MEINRDLAGALPLRRKAVAITDLVDSANPSARAVARIQAAMAYAHQNQFDEAEALAREAIAITEHMQPPEPNLFAFRLQEILRMRQAAAAASAAKQ